VGISLTALTVRVKVCAVESDDPSFTLAVIVTVPLQFDAGVRVSVFPETLVVTSDDDDIAE
jgi:hypothetical protein|tara:strand:+ start:925 stop:1107 length:183 start_codon:yes stop_codon:yes gene_type:complete